jgi:hypothetical protein
VIINSIKNDEGIGAGQETGRLLWVVFNAESAYSVLLFSFGATTEKCGFPT